MLSQKSDFDKLEIYIKGISELAIHKPDFIVMVCNTIHLYRDGIIEKSGYKNILSIREIVKQKLPENKKICILATPSTVNSGLYKFDGYDYENPQNSQLQQIANVVNNYNSTGNYEENHKILVKIIEAQNSKGAEIFLTACTEISELLHEEGSFKILSTLDILIDHVFSMSLDNLKGDLN